MKTYRTETGSIYDVEDGRVRRRLRSSESRSERVSAEWREASVQTLGVGHPLTIVWGFGRDEHSDSPATLTIPVGGGPEQLRLRTTITSRVVGIDEEEWLPSSH